MDSTTTTPTSTPDIYREMMAKQQMLREPSPEEVQKTTDLALGFSPLTVIKMEQLGLEKLLQGKSPDEARFFRERLRQIVSAANKVADVGPQGPKDRIDAIKYAANLPSQLGERFARMRRVQSGAESLYPKEDWTKFVGKTREGVDFAMQLMRRGGARLEQIASKAGQAVKEKAGQGIKLTLKDLDVSGQYMLDTPGLKERAKEMLNVANRWFEHEGEVMQAGPLNPETRALAIREALGFPSKLRHQLRFLRQEMNKLEFGGRMGGPNIKDNPAWQELADKHSTINNALDWGRKLFEGAQARLEKLYPRD